MDIAICIGVHIQAVRINFPRFGRYGTKIISRLHIFVATHRQRTRQRTNVIRIINIVIAYCRKGFHIKVRYRHGRTNALGAISISQAAGNVEDSCLILCLDFHHTRFLGGFFFLLFLFFCRKFIPFLVNRFLLVGLGLFAGCRYHSPVIYRYDSQTFAANIADCSLQSRSIRNRIIVFAGLIGIVGC